jgi:hypothetical protein
LSASDPFPEELHGDRSFSGTGIALDQIEVIASHASAQNVVKTDNASGKELYRFNCCGIIGDFTVAGLCSA